MLTALQSDAILIIDDIEARKALGQGPPREGSAAPSVFSSKAALKEAMRGSEALDTDDGLDHIRAMRALRTPEAVERIASIQKGRMDREARRRRGG